MSLLYTQVRREAMAWESQWGEHHPVVHHVKDVGFAGLVDNTPETVREQNDEGLRSDNPYEKQDPWEHYDEDLADASSPEPTEAEEAHNEEHGEYPESYDERRDQAYEKAFHERHNKYKPDHGDDELMRFAGHYGDLQHEMGDKIHYGPVSLKQPIYATQSHVSQKHLDKYHADPDAQSHRHDKYGPVDDYHGDKAPIFVTHQGRMNVLEGHHRVAAALQRGDEHINGYHYNADEHGFPAHPDDEDEEDW